MNAGDDDQQVVAKAERQDGWDIEVWFLDRKISAVKYQDLIRILISIPH